MATEANSEVKVHIQDQEVNKLDRFDGTNYARWVDKMAFFLATTNIFYVLRLALHPIPIP